MRCAVARWLYGAAWAALILGPAGRAPAAQDNQLARTPPMGWNDWYQYECRVTDSIMRANAEALANTGMRGAGYVYLNMRAQITLWCVLAAPLLAGNDLTKMTRKP